MSRLLSVGASVFMALFVTLFVIGAATSANLALGDEPLNNAGCAGNCSNEDPDYKCEYLDKPVYCDFDLPCACQVVTLPNNGGEECECLFTGGG